APQWSCGGCGLRLLSFGWDMTLRLWDVPSRRLLLTLPDVRILGFSLWGGLRAASLRGRQVRTLELTTSGVHQVLHGPSDIVLQLDFDPRHGWLASSERTPRGGIIPLWGSTSERQLAQLPEEPGDGILWELSGKALLVSCRTGLFRWPVRVQSTGTNTPARPGRGTPERGLAVRHARLGPPERLRGPDD